MNFFLRTGLTPYSRVFLSLYCFFRLYHFLIVVCCMPKCLRVRLTEFFLSRLCFFSQISFPHLGLVYLFILYIFDRMSFLPLFFLASGSFFFNRFS